MRLYCVLLTYGLCTFWVAQLKLMWSLLVVLSFLHIQYSVLPFFLFCQRFVCEVLGVRSIVRVCLSVCLSVCPLSAYQRPHNQTSRNCNRGSVRLWRQCNMLRTSGFVDEVMSAHNGPYGAWLIERIFKVTHQGAEQREANDVYGCFVNCVRFCLWRCLWLFVCVWNSRNCWTDLHEIRGKTCLVPRSDEFECQFKRKGQMSTSPGTKSGIFRPFRWPASGLCLVKRLSL